MRFDPNAISVEANYVTFPIAMPLPPVCMYTGVSGPIEFKEQSFEYLPGTAPGGAMPERQTASIKFPINAIKFTKEQRTSVIFNRVAVTGLLLQGTLAMFHRGLNKWVELTRLFAGLLMLVGQCFWVWKNYCSVGEIECVKIERVDGIKRITLRIPTVAARALQRFIETRREEARRGRLAVERVCHRRHSALQEVSSST